MHKAKKLSTKLSVKKWVLKTVKYLTIGKKMSAKNS